MSSSIYGIAGSLRRGSYNRLLLRAAAARAPAGVQIEIDNLLSGIPLFSEDFESPEPESVRKLRDAVAAADGLLIATAEYNWSLPGVLKNAIDWLSRPPREVLVGKRVAVIGASGGRWGTRLAQAALRQVLTATESWVLPAPALFVRDAAVVFDAEGRLIDRAIATQLDAVLQAFADVVRR